MPAPYAVPSFSYVPPYANPYPPPPPVAHKVWILDCRSCGMFITNRAMKAVLLLRPNVSLYSSDTLPLNCSAHTTNPDALRPPSYAKQSTSSTPSRTCECLTQTLCCHGCGSSIGYMIVIPCSRCTSSITVTNRATNGHRFVFHSSEVQGVERHYIKNEPGVIPFSPSPVIPPPQNTYLMQQTFQDEDSEEEEGSPTFRNDYLPTPPLEFASPAYARYQYPEPSSPYYDRIHSPLRRRSPPPPFHGQSYQPHPLRTSTASPPPPMNPNFYPMDQKDPPIALPSLKPGDVVFWHHLTRNGEISGVKDDERARQPATARAAGQVFFNR